MTKRPRLVNGWLHAMCIANMLCRKADTHHKRVHNYERDKRENK